MSVTARVRQLLLGKKETDPRQAYDLWAPAYDQQPGNLMLDLDEQVFAGLLALSGVAGRSSGLRIADIGCGTGRHWKKILNYQPARLIGYDVSPGMLAMLREKIPGSETYVLDNDRLSELPDSSCDLVVSTLTVAHIARVEQALAEWNRVLKPGGQVIITDYHPAALAKGGQRTFKHEGRLVAVKNHIHSISKIGKLAAGLQWTELNFMEKLIDDSVRHYYEQQNALSLFEQFRDTPIIYGIHFKKTP
jgi:ubiquinone/menaquinone biosynthesis C-methylase UbiE